MMFHKCVLNLGNYSLPLFFFPLHFMYNWGSLIILYLLSIIQIWFQKYNLLTTFLLVCTSLVCPLETANVLWSSSLNSNAYQFNICWWNCFLNSSSVTVNFYISSKGESLWEFPLTTACQLPWSDSNWLDFASPFDDPIQHHQCTWDMGNWAEGGLDGE